VLAELGKIDPADPSTGTSKAMREHDLRLVRLEKLIAKYDS
jgi:hypothetical protein